SPHHGAGLRLARNGPPVLEGGPRRRRAGPDGDLDPARRPRRPGEPPGRPGLRLGRSPRSVQGREMISPLEDVQGLAELAEAPADFETTRELSFYQLALRRLLRHRMAIIGGVCLLVVAAVSLLGPILLPASWDQPDLTDRFANPSWPHIMGTDDLGRDIFRRIMDGGRVSLSVGLLATVVVITLGVTMGTLSGYFGGLIGNLRIRFTDASLAV